MTEDLFIGRERERRTLKRLIKEVKGGKGSSVIISGEAGVGKSRLVEWIQSEAEESGLNCFRSSCISQDGLPYQPLTDAFDTLTSPQDSMRSLPLGISIFSGRKKEDSVPLFDANRSNTLRESFKKIAEMAEEEPMLVSIEELHWADKASLLAFRYISENASDHPIMLVGTYRPEEAVDYHLLDETVHHLQQRNLCKHIKLEPFDLEETRKILTCLLGTEPPNTFCKDIRAKTEGNPLFILETVKSMLAKEYIKPEENIYPKFNGTIEWPSTVKYVVERKIVKLDKKTRNLLQYASILGSSFQYSLLSEFVEMDEMEMLDYLDTALEYGIIEEMINSEGYSFSHSAVRDLLYESQFKGKKRLLHRRAAEAIESLYEKSLDMYLPQLARHYENAKLYDKSFENYVKAAELTSDEIKKIKYYRSALEVSEKAPRSLDSQEIQKALGMHLIEYGSKLQEKNEEKSSKIYLEEAKELFGNLGEETLLQKCRELLGE